jgi:putative nucleotidyltransferase with HDIG domain
MRRILFVDDERRILEGLQRMLRPCRKEWKMAFAASGSEALEILEAGPFDVIVSDMRMPNMDGARLLELVRQRHPGMIRIMLSGQCEMEAAMRAVPVAHQFLSKPCDPERLRSVIENCFECASMVADFATRCVIAGIGELPALPRSYPALVSALDDRKASLERVSAIVERDVAVAAKVLQLVNSAFFGLTREVTTIPQAVAYLGFDVLEQLVIAVELFRSFPCERQVVGFSVEEFHRHSRCVAAIAAFLPVAAQHSAAASVAALLHDIGKLVLAVRLPEPFERALQASIREHRPLYSIEEEMTGTTHAEIGAYLLGLWGLPPAVVAAVSRHHRPIREPVNNIDLRLAVHIADLLASEAEQRLQGPSIEYENGIDFELRDWSEMLPTWRQSAEEIVHREVECGQLSS